MKEINRVVVYTDGSCKSHIQQGTCAYVVVSKQEVVHSKAFRYYNTTNNRMEIEGLYQALQYIHNNIGRQVEVVIYTDSTYVRDGLTKWIHKWKGNGWKTTEKGDVLNKDLWVKLDNVYTSLPNIELKWCKGHADNKWNNLADTLCTEAYKKAVKEPEKIVEVEPSITAKKFLLDNYFSDKVPQQDKELWYQTNEWPKEVVQIMEKYKSS